MKLAKAASLLTLISLPLAALADVEFTEPAAGSTVNSGHTLTAYWRDSGDVPSLLDLYDYELFLCAGGASIELSEDLALLVPNGLFERGNSVSFQIRPDLGPVYPNAYFLKMISRGVGNVTVVNYSERFSVNGMTGKFSELVEYGLSLMNDTADYHQDLKRRQIAAVELAPAAAAAGDAAAAPVAAVVPENNAYNVPYPEQSRGLTKYAPMGKRPATTIATKSLPPQFPTSAYDLARTFLPIPTWQTTLTASRTWTFSGVENSATPAPHPKNDMELFLKRWADDE